jgi:formate dehydrogenase alpha subunit
MGKVILTIDGKKIVTDSKKTVLEAATENGIYIPTICYLKKLNPIGSCRICIVEVEGAETPMTSCQLPVMEGMVVNTKSDRLTELRQTMVKLILVNHPVDCPICERSGECKLQNMTYDLGVSRQTLKAEFVKREKRYDWRLVRYDPYLCILCERCIRICHEVQGFSAYKIRQNGFVSVIDTVDEKPLDCDFCGQCINVCPVGALNSALVLPARSWEFNKIKSICAYCGVGCSFLLDIKKDKVGRVFADDTIGMNNGNLCAKGKFGYQFIDSNERLMTPLIKKGDTLTPASWDEAIQLVGDKFKEIKSNYGGEAIAGIGSERIPNEDNYLFQKFFRCILGSHNIDNILNLKNSGFGSGLLETFDSQIINSTDYVYASDFIFSIGADLWEENPVIGNIIRMALRDNEAYLIMSSSRNLTLKPPPDYKMVYRYGSEIQFINGLIKIISDLRGRTEDLREYSDPLKDIRLEDISSKTGISKDLIETVAIKMSKSKSPVILCGSEVYTHPLGVEIVRNIQNLANLIQGKILLFREYCNSQGVNDMGVLPDKYPGYRKAADPEVKASFEKSWGFTLPHKDTPAAGMSIFDMAVNGKIKALYVMGEDITLRYSDGNQIREALKKIDFIVVQDMFLTETAKAADVILPSVSFAELEGTFTNMEGRVQKVNRGIRQAGKSKPDWEIIHELCKKMGTDFKYSAPEDIFKEIAAVVPAYKGIAYSDIKNNGKLAQYSMPSKKRFTLIQDKEIDGTGGEDMSFLLLSGNSFFHLGTMSRKSEAMNMLTPECKIEIQTSDAKNLKIKDGDRVIVKSAHGSITIKSKITNKSMPGIVFIPVNFENVPVNLLTSRRDTVTRVKIHKE